MILGYAIYLRTHRATGKQYGGMVWWTKPNQTAEKACMRRWKNQDRHGIHGFFGGFDSQIILRERNELMHIRVPKDYIEFALPSMKILS